MSAMECEKAYRVMGSNIFGPREWEKFYRVKFPNQLGEVRQFPWSEEILNAPCPFCKGSAIKDCHFAFLGISRIKRKPVTIRYLHRIHPREKQPRFYSYGHCAWYLEYPFANTTTPARWYLIHLYPIPYSMGKTYQQQVELLNQITNDYEVPCAVVVTEVHLFSFRKTGSFPRNSDGSHMWYRCCDANVPHDSVSLHPIVGNFGKDGICIGAVRDNYCDSRITIAASRRLPS
jgi:hypothetical protein